MSPAINRMNDGSGENCRQMASSLVDNLLAKAIVKASQELAFTHSRELNHKFSTRASIDMNGNPPEIQIDLVGPRTPSPVEEEINLELPVSVKQYKFKVEYDQESMFDDVEEEDSVQVNPNLAETHIQSATATHCCINEVDVATTPELEIDLEQAQEISKHIVTEIINQAVKKLNQDIKDNKQSLKHEPESFSKISCYSSRTANGNCSWINRARHALTRIMRNTCLCTKSKETFQA